MTVSSTTSKVTYAGNGATTAFAVPFNFFQASDLQVIERAVATGVETTKALTTDYTVAGGSGGTGTVTAVSAPASSVEWTIKRVLPRTQGMDLTPNDPFPANTVEESHDRAVMLVQELEEQLNRTLKFPTTDSTALSANLPSSVERASRYLAFGSDGSPVATAGTTSTIVTSAFGNSLIDDPDAATARTTLGLGTVATKNIGTSTGQVPLAETVFGKQTVWIPATALIPRTTNGCSQSTTESATNKIVAATMDFDQSTQQFAQFHISLPKSWNEGTVTAQFVWVANSGSGNVIWRITGVAISDGDAFDAAFGTAVSVTDSLIATADIHVSTETGAITIAGTPAPADEIVLQIDRDAANGGDTLNASARLLGVRLFFTTDTGVDS